MRKDKEKAVELRRQGKSYNAIAEELGIPKSTLADWFKNETWSREIRDRLFVETSLVNPSIIKLMVQATKTKWQKIHKSWQQEAVKEFPKLKNNPLFLAGIMLYWGEGDKVLKNCIVRLGNSEPEMIRIFYLFLTNVLKITPERISAWLLLYPDLIDSVQKNFWSKATGIPVESFKKSIYIQGRHPKKRLSYGVCTIVINSRALKERILKWLELYQNYLRSYASKLEN